MRRVPMAGLGLVALAGAIACSDSSGPDTAVTLLALGTPLSDVVRRDRSNMYAVPVSGGDAYEVNLSAMTDDVDLYVFDDDGGFRTPVACLVDHTVVVGLGAEACTVVASADTLYVAVDGRYIVAPTADYTIRVALMPLGELTMSAPLEDDVREGRAQAYRIGAVTDTAYSVSITGLTDSATSFHVQNGADVSSLSNLGAPKDLVVTATGSTLYFAVEGTGLTRPNATYVITATPAPVVPSTIVGTSGEVPARTPEIHWVESRGESRYQTTGLPDGTHTVSIVGLTSAAELHVFSDSTYSSELDCTLYDAGARECAVTGTAVYFAVRAGGVNRDGAGYVVLVW